MPAFMLKIQEHRRYPGLARAWVVLGDRGPESDGRHRLTAEAAGEGEFDEFIDELHEDLEKVRKKGRRAFRKARRNLEEHRRPKD